MISRTSQPQAIVAIVTGLLLAGCASSPQHPANAPTERYISLPDAEYARADNDNLNNTLYDHYQQWKGTPYRLGGLSQRGIDCSGFVYRTFRDKLGHDMPRTTRQQSREGFRIDRRDLQSGDLVFFMTEGRKRHVGIYLENGKFMHASTSTGVTISRLDNQYWRRNYWQSRRIPL